MKTPGLAAAALLLTMLAPRAGATTCPLLTDPAGDATPVGGLVPADPALDIRSADLASDGTDLTAVVRVTDLGPAGTGADYVVGFTLDRGFELVGVRGQDETFAVYVQTGGTIVGFGTGYVNLLTDEVHLTVPLATLASVATFASGDPVTHVTATTTKAVALRGNSVVSVTYDRGVTTQTYDLDSAGCITVE